MSKTPGVRRDCEPHELEPGEYGKWNSHGWFCRPPGSDLIGNLNAHQVTEHEDGTITVTPSIWINRGQPDNWHGHLTRGVWSTA